MKCRNFSHSSVTNFLPDPEGVTYLVSASPPTTLVGRDTPIEFVGVGALAYCAHWNWKL